jgi:hypothetical protein
MKQIIRFIRMSSPIPQQGGFISSFQILLSNMDSPAKLLYGFLLILLIVYSSLIGKEYRLFADSFLGRVFGIAIVYGVVQTLGWVYGLLTALAFLLLLQSSNRNPIEGFDGGGTVSEKRIDRSRRWFVEQVLGERPKKIANDQVSTYPVQA